MPYGVDGAVHAQHPTTPGTAAAAETRSPRPWLVLLTVCLGYFTANWAMAPTASILPSISRGLDLSVQEAGWVMSAYFLTLVGMVLVMGRLGDLVGQARVFGLGTLVFTCGELLCGLSPNFAVLLLGRATQGVGSAMIFGTSLAVIATAIPRRLRGRAIGMLTMSSACASLLGVGISTWSVENLTWNWAFLIPMPVGLTAAFMGFRLRLPAVRVASRRVDWLGGLLLFATITSAMLGLNHLHDGPETFEAGVHYHFGMHLVTVALFVAFVWVEQRAAAPLLRFRLLRDVNFSAGVTANGIAHMSMLATGFLVPFLLERGRGMSPSDTRVLLMVQQLSMVGCSLALGYLYDRSRSPVISILAMTSITSGLLIYGLVGGWLPYAGLLCIAAVLGGSLGGFTTVNNAGVMANAPHDQRGFAAGLVETTRQFGHTIGVSLSSSFMGAALAGVAAPTLDQYVAGFHQAAFTMGLVSSLGIVALLWPQLRGLFAGSAGETGAARPRPVAGGSE